MQSFQTSAKQGKSIKKKKKKRYSCNKKTLPQCPRVNLNPGKSRPVGAALNLKISVNTALIVQLEIGDMPKTRVKCRLIPASALVETQLRVCCLSAETAECFCCNAVSSLSTSVVLAGVCGVFIS